ncbi:unnamed protein product, partial [Prorocentrum cordatum]
VHDRLIERILRHLRRAPHCMPPPVAQPVDGGRAQRAQGKLCGRSARSVGGNQKAVAHLLQPRIVIILVGGFETCQQSAFTARSVSEKSRRRLPVRGKLDIRPALVLKLEMARPEMVPPEPLGPVEVLEHLELIVSQPLE